MEKVLSYNGRNLRFHLPIEPSAQIGLDPTSISHLRCLTQGMPDLATLWPIGKTPRLFAIEPSAQMDIPCTLPFYLNI